MRTAGKIFKELKKGIRRSQWDLIKTRLIKFWVITLLWAVVGLGVIQLYFWRFPE